MKKSAAIALGFAGLLAVGVGAPTAAVAQAPTPTPVGSVNHMDAVTWTSSLDNACVVNEKTDNHMQMACFVQRNAIGDALNLSLPNRHYSVTVQNFSHRGDDPNGWVWMKWTERDSLQWATAQGVLTPTGVHDHYWPSTITRNGSTVPSADTRGWHLGMDSGDAILPADVIIDVNYV